MKIIKKSMLTGKLNNMDLDVTHEQLDRWTGGELVQNVFPHLTADEREFLMTGSTPEEWEKAFGKEN